MVIKSVNETLYGVKTDISGSKNVKRVVVESGITLNAIQSGSINIDGVPLNFLTRSGRQ